MEEPLLEMCFRHENLVWHFFLDSQNQLCYRNSPKVKKRWSEPTVLQETYGGQFVVALSCNEQIHLAASDGKNIVWYYHFSEGGWDSCKVAEVHPLVEVNNLTLTVDSREQVHLLYCRRTGSKNGEWQIVHNFYDKNTWFTFELDEGIGISEAKTSAAVDKEDYLHVIYSAPSLTSSPLLHQVFDVNSREWKAEEQVPLWHKENQQPCIVFDRKGNLQLVWISSDGRNFRTTYTRRNNSPWPEGGWSSPSYFSEKGANAYSPYILLAGETVIALWQQLNGVFYRVSGDIGQTWSPIKKQTAVKNLEDHALNYYSPADKNSLLTAFSASGPQVTLATAASLWKPEALRGNSVTSSLLPVKANKAIAKTAEQEFPPAAKKFLLEYSDTRLTNKLLDQTIRTQEENLQQLHQEKQDLNSKLKEQFRELKAFKAISELHRKEAEGLKESNYRLEATIKTLELKMAGLEKNKEALLHQLEEGEQREAFLRQDLGRCEDTNTLLTAKIHNYQQEVFQLETRLANESRLEESTEATEPSRQNQLLYTMLTSEDYE